ncbi:transcriptional regulator, partial [Escherichia coli]
RDPSSGYLRRNVSPGGIASPLQIVEVLFPPKARVAYESGARESQVHQQVWMLEGTIEIAMGEERHRLD